MENLYDLLECTDTSPLEELKKSYQRLVLKYHPDKQSDTQQSSTSHNRGDSTTNSITSDKFIKINQAWKILSDKDLRKQYDVRWKQRCVTQDCPIQDEIDIEEFEENKDDEGDESSKLLTFPCRCGGSYFISRLDKILRYDLVCCDTCSLSIRLIYPTCQSFEI